MPDALKNSYADPTQREAPSVSTQEVELAPSSASALVSTFTAETSTEVAQSSHHKSLLQAQHCQLLNKLVLLKY